MIHLHPKYRSLNNLLLSVKYLRKNEKKYKSKIQPHSLKGFCPTTSLHEGQ
jgi:hypothetical protein